MPPTGRLLNAWKIVASVLVLIASTIPSVASVSPASGIPIRSESELPQVLTGERFHQALETRIPGVTWNGTPLRRVIREFAESSKISIVRDRRIDPTKAVALSLNNQTRRDILAAVARSVDAEARIVGHVVYLGPPAAAGPIRTLAAIRTKELSNVRSNRGGGGHARLLGRRTIQWGDLGEPRKILERIGEKFDLKIVNPEAIPHDLWEGARLPEMTAAEMLTVALIQFDLTFAWKDGYRAIRLVPLPESPDDIAITRTHHLPSDKQKVFEAWLRSTENVSVTVSGPQLIMRGRLEHHEELVRLLAGETKTTEKDDPKPMVAPLERRRFTLKVTGVPARAIMDQLEASGITFEYNADSLTMAGIDFSTPVSMDLDGAAPEVFLAATFDPLGLDFEFSGTNVVLRPKE